MMIEKIDNYLKKLDEKKLLYVNQVNKLLNVLENKSIKVVDEKTTLFS